MKILVRIKGGQDLETLVERILAGQEGVVDL